MNTRGLPQERFKKGGFTIIELVAVIMVIVILAACVVHEYVYYQSAAIISRNTQNVITLVAATEQFNLSGYTFTNLNPDFLGDVAVETVVSQLIAAGFFYPNPKVTSTEIVCRYYANPDTDSIGSAADASPGVLYFLPTKDD
jgi:prepilin-type N-terminal cleavage/methylation domain-containing protein